MIYSYGCRIDKDSNAITVIDEENITAETKGYVNGEFVEFSGGSSDFSTAEVTIVGSDMLTLPIIQEANPEQESPAFLMVARQEIGSGTYNVPLYKGGLLVTLPLNVTVSGDIQDVGMGYFITGDCSITIS